MELCFKSVTCVACSHVFIAYFVSFSMDKEICLTGRWCYQEPVARSRGPSPPSLVTCCLPVSVVVQLLSRVWLLATPWTAACQASLSFTISRSLLRLTSIESVMPVLDPSKLVKRSPLQEAGLSTRSTTLGLHTGYCARSLAGGRGLRVSQAPGKDKL